MDEFPVVPLTAAAAIVLVGPVRRRAMSVATATARAGLDVATATVVGAVDILTTAVRGRSPTLAPPTGDQ